MQYSHLTKCSEGAACEDQQSLTWTRTEKGLEREVTEECSWMVERSPWKRRSKHELGHGEDYLVVGAQKHPKAVRESVEQGRV